MTENENSKSERFHIPQESAWLCTLKLTLNLLCHVLICFVVFICIWYSCSSSKLSVLQLHIILCVLGYQFFMCQGILVLSKFNSWSLYIKRHHRRSIHWCLGIIGTILILIGTIEIIKDKLLNFNTTHGILGLCALITTLISIFNGLVTTFVAKLTYRVNLATSTKWIHGVTGIGTLVLSTASLQYGFNKQSFKKWIDNDNFIIILEIFTWFFTILVGIEFWVIMILRINYKISIRSGQRT